MLLRDPGRQGPALTSRARAANQTQLDTRRLAQWAINAVCFETNDSIMVPFKYDLNPAHDRRVASRTTTSPASDGTVGRGLGLQAAGVAADRSGRLPQPRRGRHPVLPPPSKATRETSHGRRHVDRALTRAANPDMDQVRVPQGSLFVELYCPRSPTQPDAPTDLYTYDGTREDGRLDVARAAPDGTPGVADRRQQEPIQNLTAASPNNDVSSRLPLATLPTARRSSRSNTRGHELAEFTLLLRTDHARDRANVQMDRIIFADNVGQRRPPLWPALRTMSYYN